MDIRLLFRYSKENNTEGAAVYERSKTAKKTDFVLLCVSVNCFISIK